MKRFFLFAALLLIGLPIAAAASEPTCFSAIGFKGTIDELKTSLLTKAQDKSPDAVGKPSFYNGKELGEVCITFEPVTSDQTKAEVKTSRKDDSGTNIGPETILIKTARSTKPAIFPHAMHQQLYECATCHHSRTEEFTLKPYSKNMVIQQCVICHNSSMSNPELNSLKKAAHNRCKNCHKKNDVSTKCYFCHAAGRN